MTEQFDVMAIAHFHDVLLGDADPNTTTSAGGRKDVGGAGQGLPDIAWKTPQYSPQRILNNPLALPP